MRTLGFPGRRDKAGEVLLESCPLPQIWKAASLPSNVTPPRESYPFSLSFNWSLCVSYISVHL